MTVLSENPISLNLQSELNFKFMLRRAPATEYWCQTFKVPNITLPPSRVPSPSLRVPMQGDHLVFEDLTLTFKIDDQFQNWLEMHNWMTGIGNPNNTGNNYTQLESNPNYLGYGLYSDLQLFVMDSQHQATLVFNFERCSPIFLSGPQFVTKDGTVNYMDSTVNFSYLKYHISLP